MALSVVMSKTSRQIMPGYILVTFKQIELVQARCVRCHWAIERYIVSTIFGILFLLSFLSSGSHSFLPSGVVQWFWHFSWAPNSQKYPDSTQQKYSGTPLPPALCYIWPDKGGISKVVLGFQNFGLDFWGVGGDLLKVTLQTRAPTKICWCWWWA